MGEVTYWGWVTFGGIVAVLLVVDLWVHRGARAENRKWAIVWSIIWVTAGLAFTGYVWWQMGPKEANEYLAAYLMEKSLSLDNLFVFLIIFKRLNIPQDHQRTALSWGIFGALVFRAIFIFLGARALEYFTWMEYVFAAILIYAAWHAFREDPNKEQGSLTVDWLARHMPLTKEPAKPHFLVRENGRWMATPLLVAVLALELTDVMFAIDSVPAAFAVTRNEFLVYSSNVFAILGLRSLYIVLAHTIAHLQYLHYGLAAVLAFAGVKMILPAELHIPPLVSVGIIVLMIGLAVAVSLWKRPPKSLSGGEPGPDNANPTEERTAAERRP